MKKWFVLRDGSPVSGPLAEEKDAHRWLQRHQGMSNDWAMKHEGYSIKELDLTEIAYAVADEDRHRYQISRDVRAFWTGEKRKPQRGEWYLSGAIVEAYRAPDNLSTEFLIAVLKKPKTTVTEWEEIGS